MGAENSRQFAVVTGASSGIGYELSKQFAKNGFDVLIVAEDERINTAASEIQPLGGKIDPLQVDLATYEGVEKLYSTIRSAGRPVDALAINAGVGVSGRFDEADLQAELNLVALNVTSAVHLAKRVVKDMVVRGRGRILFTSSIAATMPTPYQTIYGASKAFLRSF